MLPSNSIYSKYIYLDYSRNNKKNPAYRHINIRNILQKSKLENTSCLAYYCRYKEPFNIPIMRRIAMGDLFMLLLVLMMCAYAFWDELFTD